MQVAKDLGVYKVLKHGVYNVQITAKTLPRLQCKTLLDQHTIYKQRIEDYYLHFLGA
ncbi:hypothetical protein MP228_009666 [Amoeboaphelidium protococcarum]|nr:hypothetical protein MP228_009666 [Amoeboaphelidium protococcarum]